MDQLTKRRLAEMNNFSTAICAKFPQQVMRWKRTPANARWMLRNVPTSPFSNNQLSELKAVGFPPRKPKRS